MTEKVFFRKVHFRLPWGCRHLQAPPCVTESWHFFIKPTRNAEFDRGGALCGSERHTPHRTRNKSTHQALEISSFHQNPRSLPVYTMAAAIVSAFFDYDEVVSKVRKLFILKFCADLSKFVSSWLKRKSLENMSK